MNLAEDKIAEFDEKISIEYTREIAFQAVHHKFYLHSFGYQALHQSKDEGNKWGKSTFKNFSIRIITVCWYL
jgi:hypothetical protein